MTLLAELRALIDDGNAPSFRLMGEDLVALGPSRLENAAARYAQELEATVPPSLRGRFVAEQQATLSEARAFVTAHNTSIHQRIRGYLELGRRLDFEYPWPVVAILGIVEVMRTLERVHLLGLAGAALDRLGRPKMLEVAERTDDALRRTNRGIFADSVPTVLYALRARELAQTGERELSRLLLTGPCPVWMDEETRQLATGIVDGLAVSESTTRFRALSELTLRHFAREQAIFTFHLGGSRPVRTGAAARRPSLVGRVMGEGRVIAPRIVRDARGARLSYRPYPLPPGFELRDHDARVKVLGDAFVRSVTTSRADYDVARRWVQRRFSA